MIFLDLVGGGGSAKASLAGACAVDGRRRILTTSLAGIAGDFGESGWYEEAEEDFAEDALEGLDSPPATAGGGSSKDICRDENCDPSFPLISVEEAGVGGCSGRGIVYRVCGLVRDFFYLVSPGLTRRIGEK
jgi:hypothetical protein